MDHQLNEFKDFLSEIKDELVFLKCSVIVLIYNTGLLNIE
jgi:hypothetical protein